MKKIDWETYKKAYYSADSITKELLSSTKIYDCGEFLLKKRSLSISATDIIIPIGNKILSLSTYEESVADLKELGVTDALLFIAEIESCIKNNNSKSSIVSDASVSIPNEIQELETITSTLDGEEKIHQSSQEALLKPTEPTAAPNTPRWETE